MLLIVGCLIVAGAVVYFIYILNASEEANKVISLSRTEFAAAPERPEDYIDIVYVSWPRRMKKGDSYSLIVQRVIGKHVLPFREKYESKTYTLKDNGSLERNNGDHESTQHLAAKLSANNIDTVLNTPEWQPLNSNQRTAEWRWNVTPKQYGNQVLNISLMESDAQDQNSSAHVIWLDEFDVNVYESWLDKIQIYLSAVISGIVGAGLTVPWLHERMKEKKRRKVSAPRIGFISGRDENPR